MAANNGDATLEGFLSLQFKDEDGRTVFAINRSSETLAPGEQATYTWDAQDWQGTPVPPGPYRAVITWAGERAATAFTLTEHAQRFAVRLHTPEPGTGQHDQVRLRLAISEPGATYVKLTLRSPETDLVREQRFDEATTGVFTRTLDLSGATPGTYRLLVDATGPGGKAQAATWFRLLPTQDTQPPTVTLTTPGPGATLPRVFLATFHAQDDVGIRYVEAYLDGQLVARQGWDRPIERGALPVRAPPGVTGEQTLELRVYDAGHNRATTTTQVTLLDGTIPCQALRQEAAAAANASAAISSGNETTANASTAAGFQLRCPDGVIRDPETRGKFAYAATADGEIVDVRLDGQALFERLTGNDASQDRTPVAVRTGGAFLVLDASQARELAADLDATWLATRKGPHVLLENTETGQRALLVVHRGDAQVLGRRLVTDLTPETRLVVRPLGPDPSADAVADGIIEGRVGAEVAIRERPSDAETVSYGDLNVSVAGGDDRLEAVLSSPTHEGRTLVFTLDAGAALARANTLEILLDGEPVEPAERLEDVLDQADPDQPSQYYVVQADGETKVILQVNHFSTRELIIQAAELVEPFLTPLAVLGGLAVIGGATFALFRRPEA